MSRIAALYAKVKAKRGEGKERKGQRDARQAELVRVLAGVVKQKQAARTKKKRRLDLPNTE